MTAQQVARLMEITNEINDLRMEIMFTEDKKEVKQAEEKLEVLLKEKEELTK
jgi:hypothetical protein